MVIATLALGGDGADALIGAVIVVGLIVLARKAIRMAEGDPSPDENDRPPVSGR